jgi:hypothetical protein
MQILKIKDFIRNAEGKFCKELHFKVTKVDASISHNKHVKNVYFYA